MVRPRVADGGDVLQIWRVAANILNKQLRTGLRNWVDSCWRFWAQTNTVKKKPEALLEATREVGL